MPPDISHFNKNRHYWVVDCACFKRRKNFNQIFPPSIKSDVKFSKIISKQYNTCKGLNALTWWQQTEKNFTKLKSSMLSSRLMAKKYRSIQNGFSLFTWKTLEKDILVPQTKIWSFYLLVTRRNSREKKFSNCLMHKKKKRM